MSRSFRVPDGMTPPERSGSVWTSRVTLSLDEEGFFGRECPNPDCLEFFKLHIDDYGAARAAHRLTCPVCGTTESDEHFHTSEQIERMHAGAMELARGAMNRILSDFSRQPPTRNARGAVTFRWNAPPPHWPTPLPTYVERQTIRTFTCPNGGHRAVIYDLLSFCPYCGPEQTPPRAVFDDNLAAMRRLLAVVTELPAEAQEAIRAAGGSTALAERALGGVVAALQTLTKQLHAQAAKPAAKGNPWQNLDRIRRQWLDDFYTDPLVELDAAAVTTLRLGFARRHILEHNGGVVDQRYRDETSEGTIGRRLRIRSSFVEEVFGAATLLADQLEAAAKP
jgi:hypothetical protein